MNAPGNPGQPDQGPTGPRRILVHNPYEGGGDRTMAAEPSIDAPYDPAADGLTGEAIDKLMRSSFTDGVSKGRNDARAEATKLFAEIFGNGVEQGRQAGQQEGSTMVMETLGPAVTHALGIIHSVTGKTGSEEIKKLLEDADEVVTTALRRLQA